MEFKIIETLAQLGIGGVSLGMFYLLITRQNKNHREDRREDSKLWRDELRAGREKTETVIADLANVIRDINRLHTIHEAEDNVRSRQENRQNQK